MVNVLSAQALEATQTRCVCLSVGQPCFVREASANGTLAHAAADEIDANLAVAHTLTQNSALFGEPSA